MRDRLVVFRWIDTVMFNEREEGAAGQFVRGIDTVLSQVHIRKPEMLLVAEVSRRINEALKLTAKGSIFR